jgi:hypothetical protein
MLLPGQGGDLPIFENYQTILDLFRNPQEQGLRSPKNRSLLGVNEIFEDERNAAIGGFGRGLLGINQVLIAFWWGLWGKI